jgi:hypothetical protein
MKKMLSATLLVLAFAPLASAADADLLREKVRIGLVSIYSAVASEGAVTDHTKRVAITADWHRNSAQWSERAVSFVLQQQPGYADTCVGDAEAMTPAKCSNAATQAQVEGQLSAYLTTLVASGFGG